MVLLRQLWCTILPIQIPLPVPKSWVKELQRRGDPNVVIALAGNKADLEGRRKVEFEQAQAYAQENGILHLETSAKNANNVKALFVEIAKKLPKNPPQPEREAFPITHGG